ncbi:hypothetical protein [Jatrophihabitans sp.]|uniref:hypothetical protein n=1 Tax=Jatrophihabitans sp. TaxID=1932789 RepID=UPI002C340BEE|nr:hypothetical protein [Jatrophihabitans sp.]
MDDLRAAVTSLRGKYGDVPTVMRLRNDLERLELDVQDVHSLPPTGLGGTPIEMHQLTDEPYDASMWADDADDEGLGGYRGRAR